jgi:hypothetical protein
MIENFIFSTMKRKRHFAERIPWMFWMPAKAGIAMRLKCKVKTSEKRTFQGAYEQGC